MRASSPLSPLNCQSPTNIRFTFACSIGPSVNRLEKHPATTSNPAARRNRANGRLDLNAEFIVSPEKVLGGKSRQFTTEGKRERRDENRESMPGIRAEMSAVPA